MTQFITIAGKKQVGKDTTASLIKSRIEFSTDKAVKIVHFADVLKDAVSIIFGIERERMETEEGKQSLTEVRWPAPGNAKGDFMTVREILQFVGTDLFRTQLDPDIWARSVFRRQYKEDVVIIADCRFPNEAEHGKHNGLLVRINRNNGLAADAHISENALDEFTGYHYVLENDKTFEDLSEAVSELLSRENLI
jgi:hypothetical protein